MASCNGFLMSSTGGCGVGGNAIYEIQKQQGLYGMHFWVLKETKNAELFFIKHSLSPSSSYRVCFHRKTHRQRLEIWIRICCLVERMKLLMRTYLEACATYCETNIEQKIFISAWNIVKSSTTLIRLRSDSWILLKREATHTYSYDFCKKQCREPRN